MQSAMRAHSRMLAAAAFALLLAAGCANLGAPQERELLVSADKLSELLARRLSIDRKVLDIMQVKVDRPRVTLDPATQRLRADMDVALTHPFSSRPLSGRAAISGGLGYDPASLSVLLLEPRIEQLEIDGVPPALRDPVSRLAAVLGGELLGSYPLVSLQQKDLTAFGQEYRVLGFDIVPAGLKVILRAKQ